MAIDLRCVCIDLSNKEIKQFPKEILLCPNVRMVCMEGNEIGSLSDELFTKLPFLTWLDVRNNRLQILSKSIGSCLSLETLLLQNNCIQQLPVELALLPQLKTMNLTGNPIIYPSPDILNTGLRNILLYLKSEYDALRVISPSVTIVYQKQNKRRKSCVKSPKTVPLKRKSNNRSRRKC